MKKQLISSYLNIRHLFRLTARRVGLPGYQIHQIYLPNINLIYIPIPKNACTSLKHAMHFLEYEEQYDPSTKKLYGYQNLHDYYNKRDDAFTSVRSLEKSSDAFRFTVVRDPVERFLSCYGNRVLDLKDLYENKREFDRMNLPVEPSLNAFVEHIEEYRKVSSSIRHHTRLQSDFFGGTLSYLDKIYSFDQMDSVRNMLKSYNNSLIMKQRKSGGTKINLNELSSEALQKLLIFYRDDYELLHGFYSKEAVIKKHQSVKVE